MRSVCFALLISAAALFAQNEAQPVDAPAWMNRGVQAFKAARYDEAIQAFQKAVDLDPSNPNALLYLATSFFVQYIPGASSPENLAYAENAGKEFQAVLEIDPNNKTAIQYLASLAYQESAGISDPDGKDRQLDVARSWYEKLTGLDPKNKEAWYSLGVIDWMKWYPKWMEALNRDGLRPDDAQPISNARIRLDLKDSATYVEDGIANLKKALEIDPLYADAMAYVNLLIRERASLDDTMEQYKADIALADDWVQKSIEAKKSAAAAKGLREAPPPQTPSRIRVGGNVQECNLITKVDPVYPQLAWQARIQGTVRFQVIIAADGRMQNIQLVSGHPLLVQAARDAVQQYVYRPTLLNGRPVEVVTTVDVNFSLDPGVVNPPACSAIPPAGTAAATASGSPSPPDSPSQP